MEIRDENGKIKTWVYLAGGGVVLVVLFFLTRSSGSSTSSGGQSSDISGVLGDLSQAIAGLGGAGSSGGSSTTPPATTPPSSKPYAGDPGDIRKIYGGGSGPKPPNRYGGPYVPHPPTPPQFKILPPTGPGDMPIGVPIGGGPSHGFLPGVIEPTPVIKPAQNASPQTQSTIKRLASATRLGFSAATTPSGASRLVSTGQTPRPVDIAALYEGKPTSGTPVPMVSVPVASTTPKSNIILASFHSVASGVKTGVAAAKKPASTGKRPTSAAMYEGSRTAVSSVHKSVGTLPKSNPTNSHPKAAVAPKKSPARPIAGVRL